MKFGGTSVEDSRAFARVQSIVSARAGTRSVIVVSAMSRVTDALVASVGQAAKGDVDMAGHLLEEHFERHTKIAHTLLTTESFTVEREIANTRLEIRELLRFVAARLKPRPLLEDLIVSFGERLSASLLAAVLREAGLPARYVDARDCIVTDETHGCAAPLAKETVHRTRAVLLPPLKAEEIPVLGGFIGSSRSGETTTLGRNGSDYTAALVGAALSAQEIQIWTDVSGVLTADPRVVNRACTIPRLSFGEAADLACFGAKVLHPKTIHLAAERDIPVRICNSHAPEEPGTLVCARKEIGPCAVKAIAHKTGVTIVQVTSARSLGTYVFLRTLLEIFDSQKPALDIVTTSETSISFSLDDTTALPPILTALAQLGTVEVKKNQAIICIVGEGLCNMPGIAAHVFHTIRDINITLISQGASSSNLTFVIDEVRSCEAVASLHESFFAAPPDEILDVVELAAYAVTS